MEWPPAIGSIDALFDSDLNSRKLNSQTFRLYKNRDNLVKNFEFSIRWFVQKVSGQIPKLTIKFKKLVRIKSIQYRTAFSASSNAESYKNNAESYKNIPFCNCWLPKYPNWIACYNSWQGVWNHRNHWAIFRFQGSL